MRNQKVFGFKAVVLVLTLCLLGFGGALGLIRAEYKADEAGLSQPAEKMKYRTDRIIVEADSEKDAKQIAKENNLKVYRKFKELSRLRGHWVGVLVKEKKNNASIEEIVQTLRNTRGIRRVEFDHIFTIAATPNDPRFSELWGMHNTGQTGGTADADIDAPEAWDLATGSADVIVAVVDTGINYNHTDLAPNMWKNPGEIAGNGQDDDGNGYIDDIYGIDTVNDDTNPIDDNGHGSHCAGTIGAKGNDGFGVVGVNWNVKFMALKSFNSGGSGYTSDSVTCYEYLIDQKQRGQNIVAVSNSWSGSSYVQDLVDVINIAGQEGILSVCAAGNNSRDNDQTPIYPACYDSVYVISVAATDHNDALASFSNWGAVSVDLSAPGVNVLSCVHTGNDFGQKSGTSMATPHVSGAVALLASVFSNDTPQQRKDRILNFVDPIPAMSGKCVSGGRLNVFKAVQSDPFVVADFEWSKDGDFTRIFTDQSTANYCTITGWNWDFGDGNTSTQQNPTHTYSSADWFNVTLTVTADTGASDSKTKTVWAGPNLSPTANFTYSTPGGFVVNFSDQSTDIDGTIAGWNWDFGDGNTSSQQNPSHQYQYPGTYTVTLTVTDDEGGTDSITKTVAVPLSYCASSSLTANPVAISMVEIGTFSNSSGKSTYSDFMHMTLNLNTGQTYDVTITLDDDFWTCYTRIYIDYNLDGDFNDANEIALEQVIDTSYTGTITIPSSGVVTDRKLGMRVSAKTSSYRGPCDDSSGWGEVEDYTIIFDSTGNQPPTADFTYTTNALTVDFTDQSSDPDGTIDSWSWDFGDGGTSTAQNPSHTYGAAGTYTVTLTVTDNEGATDSVSKDVTVSSPNQPPTADFTYTTNNLTVNFTDQSSDPDGTIQSWSWNFGDGGTSTAQNPSHTYGAAGTYNVTLTVTDNDGATDSVSKNVTVSSANQPPTADFTYTTDGLTANFTDQSSDPDGTIQGWSWNFGDGGTSTAQNPSHTYGAAGTYTVTLTVTDNEGATDSVSKNVTVTTPQNQPPTADFTYTTDGLTANFTDQSSDPDGTITNWSWNFGDGGSSTVQNPSHTYGAAGTYTVTLTVTDNDGATDSTSKQVTVSDGGGIPTYCASSSISTNPGYITQVVIDSFSNSSGAAKYSDFTNMTVNMTKGQTASVSLTPYTSSYIWDGYWRIWIDYNRDGDFNDAGELVFENWMKDQNGQPLNGSFTVPSSGVVTGQKVGMRVSFKISSYRDVCATNSGWGEVEDYAVIIQ
ncbi:MAG: PKD domain-containing protein [Candidatus Aminicenantes bacterium]|nr:PKD domain-containing protein [Candidatus Aminicenantes bacterium]NIM77726.1 PKD domain-containing protein [Candidatus Aminicenantes bacterium]NIN17039.1 PKD domain-containing protein [Candidatus Aminicenantes bacterium]NIN40932.1 PKD domain-containing protein [Candidatus Aminicenantes bacterium]NIN83737.1 PKD domain-containing protein [Candidatus Aminicenantes bacterium]